MPELASIRQASIPLPAYRPQSPVTPVRYADPVTSTEAASTAAAFATLAQAIGSLPDAMMNAYQEGRRNKITGEAEKQITSRLNSGDTSDLAIETGPKGTSVSLNKPDPYGDLKALIARQNLINAQQGPNRYQNLVDRANTPPGSPAAPAPSPGPATGPATGPLSSMADLPLPEGQAPQTPSSGLAALGNEPPLPNANQDPIAVATPPSSLESLGEKPVLDPNTGQVFTKDVLGRNISVDPTGKIEVIKEDGSKTKEGFTFESIQAANAFAEANGFNSPKVKQVDGKLVVDEFTPKDVDEKGKVKLTDSTRKELSSAANLMADLKGLEKTQEELYNQDKAGPIAGRLEQFKAKMGFGDATYVGAAGQIDVGQFKIARLLNGPGVLTDKDITRAQSVAPTLNETPASFKAKMQNVRRMLKESVQTWLTINGSGATPDQKLLAESAIKALESEGGETAPESSKPTANMTAEIDKRQALLDRGVKADGTPLNPRERAAVQMLLDRERAKLR